MSINTSHPFVANIRPAVSFFNSQISHEVSVSKSDIVTLLPSDLGEVARKEGIPLLIMTAAYKLNRIDSLMNMWDTIRLRRPFNGETIDAQYADLFRKALGLPEGFFPKYWDSTSNEASQWLRDVCQAIYHDIPLKDIDYAISRYNLNRLLNALQHPEYFFTPNQLNLLQNSNQLAEAIIDVAVYEIPSEFCEKGDDLEIRKHWRYCCWEGLSPAFLLSEARAGKLQKLVYQIEKAKQDGISQASMLRLFCSGNQMGYDLIKSQLLFDSTGHVITSNRQKSSLSLDFLAHAISQIDLFSNHSALHIINDSKGICLIERINKAVQLYYLEPKTLGEGEFGIVFKVFDVAKRCFYALKVAKVSPYEPGLEAILIEREFHKINGIYEKALEKKLISSLDERLVGLIPRPVRIFELKHVNFLGMLMPIFPHTLEHVIFKNASALNDLFFSRGEFNVEKDLYLICLQLFHGLTILHGLGYFHGDVSKGNIGLRSHEGKIEAVLFDLGEMEEILEHFDKSLEDVKDLATRLREMLDTLCEHFNIKFEQKQYSLLTELKGLLSFVCESDEVDTLSALEVYNSIVKLGKNSKNKSRK